MKKSRLSNFFVLRFAFCIPHQKYRSRDKPNEDRRYRTTALLTEQKLAKFSGLALHRDFADLHIVESSRRENRQVPLPHRIFQRSGGIGPTAVAMKLIATETAASKIRSGRTPRRPDAVCGGHGDDRDQLRNHFRCRIITIISTNANRSTGAV